VYRKLLAAIVLMATMLFVGWSWGQIDGGQPPGAAPQPKATDAPARPGLPIALVNIPRVFEQHVEFKRQIAQLKSEVEELKRQLAVRQAEIETVQKTCQG